MVRYEYVCNACGFTSEEKKGVYLCPKCGNKMRPTNTGKYGGDFLSIIGRWILIIIAFFVFLFVGVLVLGVLGIFIAFIVACLVWWVTRRTSQDMAIKINGIKYPDRVYFCKGCGGKFKGQLSKCPHCGVRLKY